MAVFCFCAHASTRAKAIAVYGVMSSKQSPYGDQNSHIPGRDMQKNSKHCLVVPRGSKSYIFPAGQNARIVLAGEISPDPLSCSLSER